MKVCLITSAKDEDSHIEEFIDHYFNIIGIDHIFWIDNNTEPLKPVNINDDRVTVIDKRHVNFDSGENEPILIMKKTLNEVYQEYIVGSEYDYCCYFDPDELLEINCNIKEYIINKNKNVILIPWVMHSNNNYIWESELPSKYMKVNYGFENNYSNTRLEYKPIFRTKKEYELDIFFYDKNGIINNCDESDIYIDNDSKLHHYRIQCIETYIKHKIKNGFYGQKYKSKWCRNLFASSQFRTSNVYISKDRSNDFKELIIYYGIDKYLTYKDKSYLRLIYNITINN